LRCNRTVNHNPNPAEEEEDQMELAEKMKDAKEDLAGLKDELAELIQQQADAMEVLLSYLIGGRIEGYVRPYMVIITNDVHGGPALASCEGRGSAAEGCTQGAVCGRRGCHSNAVSTLIRAMLTLIHADATLIRAFQRRVNAVSDSDDDEAVARRKKEKEEKELARQLKEATIVGKIVKLRLKGVSLERKDAWIPLRVRKVNKAMRRMELVEAIAAGEAEAGDAEEFAGEEWLVQKPERPEGWFRGGCYEICYHRHFGSFILYVILVNVLVMVVGALFLDSGAGSQVVAIESLRPYMVINDN